MSGKHRGSVFWILSVSEPVILYEHVIYILGNKVVFTTVIAVKPLLTGWCGSQHLVKCNVPQDSILAIAPLYWDSFFFISMSFLFFSHFLSYHSPTPSSFSLSFSPTFCSPLVLLSPLRPPLWCCAKYFWLDTAYMQNANYGEIRCSTI